MPTSIKIYPPSQLPDKGVSETQFNIWTEELEVYLTQDDDFSVFLPGGDYAEWLSQEANPDRVVNVKPEHRAQRVRADAPDAAAVNAAADEQDNQAVNKIRKNLRTVLSIIGKCVPEGQYISVVRHSTSIQWIYKTLRSDYDIQQKGIHFFNILDVRFDQDKTPISFYNQYRTVITNNLGKTGDVIKYKDNLALTEDEKTTPMLEDIILLNVIREIDPRLPSFVKTHYNHKMKQDERLMDFKTDILINIPSFIEQLNTVEQNNSIKEESANLKAFRTSRKSNFKNKTAQPSKYYCRLCFKSDLPREVYTSHNIGDIKCTSMSKQDRERFIEAVKLNTIQETDEPYQDEEEIAEMFGYGDKLDNDSYEVTSHNDNSASSQFPRTDSAKCSYIKPVPSQILTMFLDSANKVPIHIDLDSGATLNYVRESEVLKNKFKIHPNGQLSKLGDGVTKMKSIGEIHETFFRNNWEVKFSAVVCRQLTSPFIGGTVFLKQNGIDQDFHRDVIHINNRAVTVQPTDPVSLLPIGPVISAPLKVKQNPPQSLFSFKSRILLPGQTEEVKVDQEDGAVVAIEPMETNKNSKWPEPRLQTITNGKLAFKNTSNDPIFLGKEVKQYRVRQTEEASVSDPNFYPSYTPKLSNIHEDNTPLISVGDHVPENIKKLINDAHDKFKDVFNKDLSQGYNGSFGQHKCRLNWATSERPLANKVRVPSYDHSLKGVQQDLMDELTDQGVLLIPQQHNISVQAVCPSFIQRKQRARNKPKHSLTKSDVRLLINFGPVNDLIKPVPCHVPKTDDVLIMIGRWKYIIQMDLYNGYFQNHMSEDAIPWLGVQTPFGGLRVLSRSGQGLMGMAEEFDELTAKVLKQEMQDGISAKIVDDVVVGGETMEEAAQNYIRVLEKLQAANLKVTPEKTVIFPKRTELLGWIWEEGGHLSANPHRTLALTNTKTEDIKTVQDMRSWFGLFKTLHIVTPDISEILAPFEAAAAGKESKDEFQWTHELESKFRKAKAHINNLVTLYLPSPNDQLILETDASKGGIGHVLYAIKDGRKLPVRLHSTKLPEKCLKWSPCDNEALALAVGVDKEYDIIRESRHPLLVRPDSKPVHEAIKLVNQGKFSTSARISSFLTNINRTKIESRHVSGKAKLNPFADLQSRILPDCEIEGCSIHKFLEDVTEAIVDEGAKNCKIESSDFSNRISWLNSQKANQACNTARQLLTSGKPPPKAMGKHAGEFWNDVRQYCREAMVSRDGLLVVKAEPDVMSGNLNRERIVVPKPLVPALLYHLHNHNEQHPVKSQQKARFTRQFYAIHLEKHLELLYKNCYKCSVVQKLPKEVIVNETQTEVKGPQTHFHADVVKRASQNILTIKDHFSSYQDAMLIQSEKAQDLKEGLIMLTSSIRRPSDIFISVDNSPGFKSLINSTDKDLMKLKINLVKTDEINKNANAVIDKGCQELEEELKRLDPECVKINSATLKLAILNLNSKLRRRGNISAYEINTARDQNTGDNMNLDDDSLRSDQKEKRTDARKAKDKDINVGDTVTTTNKSDKHKANDMFIVTAKENDKVSVQKILHPLSNNPAKIMSKVYTTQAKHLTTIHRPETPDFADTESDDDKSFDAPIKQISHWSPIDQRFFQNDDSDDDSQENVRIVAGDHMNDDENNNEEVDVVAEPVNNDNELQWDSSPEQLALGHYRQSSSSEAHSADNTILENVLQPRQLFEETDDEVNYDDDELTSDTEDDEVFASNVFQTPPTAPRLRRSNAFRKKKPKASSEPRITRNMLNSDDPRISLSNPTSPSEVVLDRAQNLNRVLNPRVPILPELVNLGPQVQVLDQALNQRRSERNRNKGKVDYKKLNEEGRGN